MSPGQRAVHMGLAGPAAPHRNHSVAVSLMEGGVRSTGLGPPWSTGLSPVYQGLAAVGPSSGCALGDSGRTGRHPVGLGEKGRLW